MKQWEDFISLNSTTEPKFEVLGCASEYYETDKRQAEWDHLDYQNALQKDRYPLPQSCDREYYYGDNHFSYWASGFRDKLLLEAAAAKYNIELKSYLDLGCASGRVIRHFALQNPQIQTMGCDINRFHVEWCNLHLPKACTVFQNSSIPSLPLPDNSVDLISAFSVFTHIEAMETTWLMEIKRVLRPGGMVWLTFHSEETLRDMDENWPLWKPVMNHALASELQLRERRAFEGNRLVLRWHAEQSYSSNVFYKMSYIQNSWGRIFDILQIRRRCPNFQDVVIAQKPLTQMPTISFPKERAEAC